MKLLLLLALVTLALANPVELDEDDDYNFELFKIKHEKTYENEAEELKRKAIFKDNLKFIREHNAKYKQGKTTFTVGINKFADMTSKEFKETMNGLRIPAGYKRTGKPYEMTDDDVAAPKEVDWRKEGAVTPVKDQGQCGSCWAFSSTGSLEGQTFLKTKKLISLSEQNLVDCSAAFGNEGCSGGLMDQAFSYIKANRGIDTESSYPYQGTDDKCRYKSKNKGATDTGFVDIAKGNEKALQDAVAKIGPISIAIDADHTSFQLYESGVYKESKCSSKNLDHGVLAVGYGTVKKGGDYWIVKNSWGEEWGMKGYILMARNHKNMCGVASMASYPTV